MNLQEVCRRISAHHVLEVCKELLPNGQQIGDQWISSDATDAEGRSFNVNLSGAKSGQWTGPDPDEYGDILDLIASIQVQSPTKAAEWAASKFHLELNGKPKPVKNGHFDPLTIQFKTKEETVWRNPTDYWTYHDANGKEIGWDLWFDPKIIPGTRTETGGKIGGWKHPTKKPIYNLHLLSRRPNDPVLIVGSARAAFAASKHFPDVVCISWMGGSKSVSSVDWSPVKDRDVVIWPDANKVGREASTYLLAHIPMSREVNTSTLPLDWDLDKPIPKGVSIHELFESADFRQTAEADADKTPCPFRCLGCEGPVFYYLSHASGDIVHLRPAEHTDLNLQMIATDDYWVSKRFVNEKSGEVDYKSVAKHLLQTQQRVGHFNPDNVRGLGCWLEGSTVVYHAGECLYVDGVRKELHEHDSRYIYSRRKSIAVNLAALATVEQGQQLVQLCDMLPWAPGQMAWCYSAMIFIAQISGALQWRPNLWLTGIMGSGKSWAYDNILTPMFGDAVLAALSTTSAAGIRQTIQSDAIPVIIDEIESKDEKSHIRIQAILELVRQSSSETAGAIRQGTPEGKAKAYRVRCCFLFSSIAMGALEPADLSRFARLDFLTKPPGEKQAHFDQLQAFTDQTAAIPSWCEAIRARAIVLAPVVRRASEIMRRAISQVSGDSRKGQQYGTLAAGYWMLTSDTPPTPEQATDWAAQQDWEPLGAGTKEDADHSRVIEVLLQYPTTYEDGDGRKHTATVGELLDIYYRERGIKRDNVYDALMRLGVHPIYDSIDIATRHSELAKVFKNTPYANRWSDHIRRLEKWENHYFKAPGGRTQRCIRIPKTLVCDSDPEPDLPSNE